MGNLRSSAFEAIMALLQNFPNDCYVHVYDACVKIVQKLQMTMQIHVQDADSLRQFTELQSLLCASLMTVVKNLQKSDLIPLSETIMSILVHIFQSQAAHSTSVLEDALLALSAMIEGWLDRAVRVARAKLIRASSILSSFLPSFLPPCFSFCSHGRRLWHLGVAHQAVCAHRA